MANHTRQETPLLDRVCGEVTVTDPAHPLYGQTLPQLDQLDNAALGSNIARFITQPSDFIVVVGTPTYYKKYENKVSIYGSVVAAEVDLINVRLTGSEEQKASVIPVLLEGEEYTSLPPLLHRRVYGDFRKEEMYFVTLFDLLLTLYRIPFDDPAVQDVRAELRKEGTERVGKRL